MTQLMRPLNEVREQMERIFADLTEELAYPTALRSDWRTWLPETTATRNWLPAIEVSETDKAYLIKAEVPGLNPEDIHVEILGNVVTLQGETCKQKTQDKQHIHRSELRYGRFFRQIPLPSQVNAQDCQASFQAGILALTLPKLEDSQRKRIQVKVSS